MPPDSFAALQRANARLAKRIGTRAVWASACWWIVWPDWVDLSRPLVRSDFWSAVSFTARGSEADGHWRRSGPGGNVQNCTRKWTVVDFGTAPGLSRNKIAKSLIWLT